MYRKKSSTPPRNIADLYAESRFKKSSTAPFLNVTSGASVTDKELPVRDRFAAAAQAIKTHIYLHEIFIVGLLLYVFFSGI